MQRTRSTATRRKQPVGRKPTRAANRSFLMIMIVLVAFAAFYHFAGDRFFPGRNQYVPLEGEILVHFIDVGQGNATLIQSDDHAVLIDGGESRYGQQVVTYLRNAGVTRLDYVVATHPHSDHIGGLTHVLNQLDVGRVVMPDASNNSVAFDNFLAAVENHDIPVTFVTVGDKISAGIIQMVVLAPVRRETPWPSNRLNDASVVLRMVYGQTSFLFTGDAESASEQAMLSSGLPLQSNVLLISHHGSHTSTTQDFLDAVKPVAAVISVGNNTYGHPHRATLDRLNAADIRILRTDELGTIIMSTDGTDITRW
jgi:beta-lactamase superfamily II metal-dependent hydrolase